MFSPDFLSTLTFSSTLPAGTQSVIPAHSVLGSSFASLLVLALWVLSSSRPQPSRSFRPTRLLAALSFTCLFTLSTLTLLHSRDSVGHSGPLGPGLSSSFSSLLSPLPLTTALTQSVIPAHSVFGFLHLALLLSIIFTFFHSLDSVGHSGPLGPALSSFFPSLLFPLPVTTALTQSVIPAHSVFGFLHLSLPPSLIFTFFHSLDSVGHSGPLSPWLPWRLFSLLFSWFLGFPTTA